MKILLIEDDPETAGFVANGLREHGHVVDQSADGRDGLFLASGESYDMMVIDRMLPRLDGLAIVKTVRAAGIKAPVLVLTTLGGVNDRVEGLEAGADDYLVKPFAFAELLARVNALARRHCPAGAVIEVRLAAEAGAPVLCVADTGQGIPAVEREKVLRRFYRLETSRTTPGSGLGLALVKAVAELHGASIELSDNGPGLRVNLRFRASSGAGARERATSADVPSELSRFPG